MAQTTRNTRQGTGTGHIAWSTPRSIPGAPQYGSPMNLTKSMPQTTLDVARPIRNTQSKQETTRLPFLVVPHARPSTTIPGILPGVSKPCCSGCASGMGCFGGGDKSICKVMQASTTQGTMQLQGLNGRLVSLLQKSTSKQVDLSVFAELHEVIQEMKEESSKTSERYQAEIRRLNEVIERRSRDGSKEESKVILMTGKVNSLEEEITSLKVKFSSMEAELRCSEDKRTILVKERAEMEMRIRQVEFELELSRKESQTSGKDGGILIIQHTKTKQELSEATTRITILEDQLRHITILHDKEKSEWERKISIFQRTISKLEVKIRELMQSGTGNCGVDIRLILSQLNEMFQREIVVGQQQTEAALHQSLHHLHAFMDRSSNDVELDHRYQAIKADCVKSKGRVTELETQVQSYNSQIATMRAELDRERATFQAKVTELEQRLAEFYRQYIEKTQECSMARHGQMALQGEISALRAIVEAEESKGCGGSGQQMQVLY